MFVSQNASTPNLSGEPDQSQLVLPWKENFKRAAKALLVEQVGTLPTLPLVRSHKSLPLKKQNFYR